MSGHPGNRVFALRLALAALLLSHVFVAGLAGVFGAIYGPNGAFLGDPGTFVPIEACALVVSVLVGIACLGIARRPDPVHRCPVALGMVALVVAARLAVAWMIGLSGLYVGVFLFSYVLSWGVPELIAFGTTLLLHRKVFGASSAKATA